MTHSHPCAHITAGSASSEPQGTAHLAGLGALRGQLLSRVSKGHQQVVPGKTLPRTGGHRSTTSGHVGLSLGAGLPVWDQHLGHLA
jgi:hypothetical protein